MLTDDELRKRERKRKNKGIAGIGFNFASNVLGEIQTMDNVHLQSENDIGSIDFNTASSQEELQGKFNSISQQDASRAMLSGLDLNSGTVAQVASQRQGLLSAESNRLALERQRQVANVQKQEEHAESNEGTNIFLDIALGVLGFLFL